MLRVGHGAGRPCGAARVHAVTYRLSATQGGNLAVILISTRSGVEFAELKCGEAARRSCGIHAMVRFARRCRSVTVRPCFAGHCTKGAKNRARGAVRGHEHVFGALPSELHEAMLNSYIREAIDRPISDDELRPYLQPWLGDPGQTAFYRQMAQFDQRFTDEIQQRYRDVRAPTLIIWGEQDRWLPIAQGRELATLIPDASFRPVAGSGHLVQEDAPEAIIAALMATPSRETSRPETVASST